VGSGGTSGMVTDGSGTCRYLRGNQLESRIYTKDVVCISYLFRACYTHLVHLHIPECDYPNDKDQVDEVFPVLT